MSFRVGMEPPALGVSVWDWQGWGQLAVGSNGWCVADE